jgi:large subunit ribosomal protein L30
MTDVTPNLTDDRVYYSLDKPQGGKVATAKKSVRRDIVKYDKIYDEFFGQCNDRAQDDPEPLPRMVMVTLVKSTIGRIPKHRRTAKALGLTRVGKSAIHELTDPIKGMLNQIEYLLDIQYIMPFLNGESPEGLDTDLGPEAPDEGGQDGGQDDGND